MTGVARDPAILARVRALAAALLTVVFVLVFADPTPSFLGFVRNGDATPASTVPASSGPRSGADYSPPQVSKPPESTRRVGVCRAFVRAARLQAAALVRPRHERVPLGARLLPSSRDTRLQPLRC